MQQTKTVTLATIFSDVLANLAFMFGDEEMADPSLDECWLETTISYMGPTCGTLRFRCTSAFTRLLAGNLLGVAPEADDAESKANDAVKEFMNIVCGQLVTALHGDDDVFNLTIPELRPMEELPDLDIGSSDQVACLSVEGHRVQLCYQEN